MPPSPRHVAVSEFIGTFAAEGDDAALCAEQLADGVDGDFVGRAQRQTQSVDHAGPFSCEVLLSDGGFVMASADLLCECTGECEVGAFDIAIACACAESL